MVSNLDFCSHFDLLPALSSFIRRVRSGYAPLKRVLAWRGVPPRRIVVHAAVAYVHAGANSATQRPAALDNTTAASATVATLMRTQALACAPLKTRRRFPLTQSRLA